MAFLKDRVKIIDTLKLLVLHDLHQEGWLLSPFPGHQKSSKDARRGLTGWVSWHSGSERDFIEAGRNLSVTYAGHTRKGNQCTVEIGNLFCNELKKRGIQYEWGGDSSQHIVIKCPKKTPARRPAESGWQSFD